MISNGFDTEKVLAALTGRVGWRQPAGSGPVLDTDNKKATSGRYFQEFHSIVTIQNVYSSMEQAQAIDSDFNAYLSSLQSSVILQALNEVFKVPQLVESQMVFEKGVYYNPQLIPNAGKFCGFQIRVAPGQYAVQLSNVELLFNRDVTFKLYLFNENRRAPIWSQEVSATAGDQTILPLQDCIFKFSSENNKGGLFYFGYFQDDLGTAQALEQNFNDWNCGLLYDAVSFESAAIGLDFDRTYVYGNYRNYGLNLELNVFRDYTRVIIQNAYLFDELIGLHMAAKVVEGVIYSTRSNKTERITAESSGQLYTDLNLAMPVENSPFGIGIKSRITREVKKVYHTFFPKEKIKTSTPAC